MLFINVPKTVWQIQLNRDWKKQMQIAIESDTSMKKSMDCRSMMRLTEAIMFSARPDEYIDPKTGATKKRQIKYYPEQYKERYGKTYSDYMAAHPQDDFEKLDDYVAMKTIQDVFPSSAVSPSTISNGGEQTQEAVIGGVEQDAGKQ